MDILSKLKQLKYIINIFFIYSFLGFLFESIVSLIGKTNFNSGILYGPCTFIYGIAIFLIMILNRFLKQYQLPKWLEVLLFFIGSSLIMTVLEFSAGMLIEKFFGIIYWDYSTLPFNHGFYICFLASLFWGLFATMVNYFLTKKLDKLANLIPWYITIIFIILFIVDIAFTLLKK